MRIILHARLWSQNIPSPRASGERTFDQCTRSRDCTIRFVLPGTACHSRKWFNVFLFLAVALAQRASTAVSIFRAHDDDSYSTMSRGQGDPRASTIIPAQSPTIIIMPDPIQRRVAHSSRGLSDNIHCGLSTPIRDIALRVIGVALAARDLVA